MKITNYTHRDLADRSRTTVHLDIDEGERSVLWDEMSSAYHKTLRTALAGRVADSLDLDDDDVRLHWSRTAGCACGCSPGLVVKVRLAGAWRAAPKGHFFTADVQLAYGYEPPAFTVADFMLLNA